MSNAKAQNQNVKICAGIVTYNSKLDQLFQLVDVLFNEEEIDGLFIIDNNSKNQDELDSLIGRYKNLNIIKNDKNVGVASAINMLCCYGKTLQCDFILPFDQDSVPQKGFLNSLVSAFKQKQDENIQVAAVGPMQIDMRTGRNQPFIRFRFPLNKRLYNAIGTNTIACDFLISSGCLISTSAIEKIGAMEESFFIDNVDLEWSLRARSQGFSLFGVKNARMYHCIGEKGYTIPFFNINIQIHRPFRTFFMTRNRISLYKRNYIPLVWKINDVIRLIFKLGLLFTINSNKKDNFYYFCKALKEVRVKELLGAKLTSN